MLRKKTKTADSISLQIFWKCRFTIPQIVVMLSIIIPLYSYTQNHTYLIDSLRNKAKNTQNIETKTLLLKQLMLQYGKSNSDSSLFYFRKALNLTKRINNESLLADIYLSGGKTFREIGVMDSANFYLFKSLSLYENIGDNENIIKAKVGLGEFYRAIALYSESITYLKQALILSKKYSIHSYLPQIYNRLGATYYEYNRNLDTIRKAIAYIDTSRLWAKKINDFSTNSSNYNVLGASYQNLMEYEKANDFLYRALNEADLNGEIIEKPMIYKNIGTNYFKLKQYDKAIEIATKGAKLADSLGINMSLWFNYHNLFVIYDELKDYQKALVYYTKVDSVKYLVYTENSMARTKENEAKYKNKEKELLLEKKENEIITQKKQLLFVLISFILTVLIVAVAGFFAIRLRNINALLSLKNTETNIKTIQLENSLTQIEKLNQFKEDLSSMIVHDLKNPLNTIINMSSADIHTPHAGLISNKERNLTIVQSAFQMLHLVNNILDIQKFEETQMELLITTNSINKTIDNTLANVKLLLDQRNITIHNKIDNIYFAKYDNELIERVLINLLTNAIKFSPPNEFITIDCEKINQDIKIKIIDNGDGIPKDKIPVLFKKYSRAEIRKIGYSASTGLGLAFSKLVIDNHQGEIGVVSVLGQGSCFWFSLKFEEVIQAFEETPKAEKDNNIEYSTEFLQQIIPLKDALAKFKFYETSEILATLSKFEYSSDEFANWKTQVENAVLYSNKDHFLELISMT